ncbi:MAG: VCBS repeat-containing protein [Bacteroidetes bacterium]|nr:VCBS repeat-containing protein [Bacteroidota bacterium]
MIFLKRYKIVVTVLLAILMSACNSNKQPTAPVMFETLTDKQTGLHFSNTLTPTDSFNMFHYMYFYNGAGVGAGDFNNDGKTDLFFAANQGSNKLYLNEGQLKFKDVTAEAKIPQDGQWSTGVSVVDINNDGLLDIYICRVGNFRTLHGKNQLLICKGINNGVPFYEDETDQYGLGFSGFSTQALFFDYDLDGDLDMFLLNHSVHQNGTFAPRKDFIGTYNPLSGDRLFRNDGNNHFTDVTVQSTINSSAISYGLGVAAADINLDGWPDLYVGNDFHEDDYLYINQHNGTFAEKGTSALMHTSQFSMGVDVADVNNDGFPEIISMDMLPSDPAILKRSLGEDDYDIFYHKIDIGYSYQYTRNNLQYNRRNGMFSEVGLYAGVYASDWSWAPLWMDFDNDGLKDLFISNGIPKRMNDMDYANFISDGEIQRQMRENNGNEKDMALINKFPEIKLPNCFYHNKGNMQFEEMNASVAGAIPTFSNGAVYADLDNDGDLDVVVNNVNEPVLVYENKSNDAKDKQYASLQLKGAATNINATGAKVVVFSKDQIRTYEKYPVKGFLSSMEEPMLIGLTNTKVDSAFLIWPDNTYQPITFNPAQPQMKLEYQKGLPQFDYARITTHYKSDTKPMEDITATTGLQYCHKENTFVEFNREFLIPHMVSTEGPALAVGDIDHDGLEDIFIGASRTHHNAVYLQQPDGKFIVTDQPDLFNDSLYEDVDAVFTDVNKDGNPDLVIASGGNEYYGQDEKLKPRVYLNDGKAHFKKLEHAFGDIFVTQSCVVPFDFNGDGYIDLFLGGRVVPWEYGKTPPSYLLLNDGTGKFKDVTAQYAKDLATEGMVTNAQWVDMDKDGKKDLLVCNEWGGIDVFLNNSTSFTKKTISADHGWWNFILPVDVNNDGNIDIIAGNLGLNSRLHASKDEPVKLYYNDFDNNGKKEQIMTYFLNGKELPFANKDELQRQLPFLKKKFLYASDFAKATLTDIFTDEKLSSSDVLTATNFSNAILINKGNLQFDMQPMPWEAQLSPMRCAAVVDANGDHQPDILLAGNYYDNNIQMGRYDADFGTVLVNKGNNQFAAESINGMQIKGQVRHISPISINHQPAYIMAMNNDSLRVIRYKK